MIKQQEIISTDKEYSTSLERLVLSGCKADEINMQDPGRGFLEGSDLCNTGEQNNSNPGMSIPDYQSLTKFLSNTR